MSYHSIIVRHALGLNQGEYVHLRGNGMFSTALALAVAKGSCPWNMLRTESGVLLAVTLAAGGKGPNQSTCLSMAFQSL